MHSPCFIKTVRAGSQPVATYFYLCTSLLAGMVASLVKQLFPDTPAAAFRRNRQLHDFANTFRMMKLVFHPQIDASLYFTVGYINQTRIIRIL